MRGRVGHCACKAEPSHRKPPASKHAERKILRNMVELLTDRRGGRPEGVSGPRMPHSFAVREKVAVASVGPTPSPASSDKFAFPPGKLPSLSAERSTRQEFERNKEIAPSLGPFERFS